MATADQNTHLLDQASILAERFSPRAADFDQARKLDQDASDAMAEAGFYRLFVPEQLGGLEAVSYTHLTLPTKRIV